MGADPIRMADILAYFEIEQVPIEMRTTYMTGFLALEDEWLSWAREKQK